MRIPSTGLAYLLALLIAPVPLVLLFIGPDVWSSDLLIDAASFRNGAQFIGTPNLYNPDAYAAAQQREISDAQAYRTFLRPPWYAAAASWLADMPYRTAMNSWRIVMAGFALLFVFAWREWPKAALAICWSVPLLSALLQGQDDSVMLAALAISLLLLRREHEVLAGVALSFCAIKPHLFLFVPIALIAARRSRIGIGLSLGLALQIVVSFFVQGSAWPTDYLRALLPGGPSDISTNGVSLVYLFKAISPNAELAASLLFITAGGVFIFRIARTALVPASLCAAFAAAVITSPHAFLQDMLLVIPLALLSLDSGHLWSRRLALFFLSSAWAIAYLIAANEPSISIAATLLAVLPVIGLLVRTRWAVLTAH